MISQVRLFDGKSSAGHKNASSVWYDDGSASDVAATTVATTGTDQSPVRPPRRRCKPTVGVNLSGPAKRSHSLTTCGMTTVSAEIKSILKKPASLTTDDLSPVRSRTPIAASSTVVAGVSPCNGSQKKTKKQVQFDIVSVAVEKPTETSHRSETAVLAVTENLVENTPSTASLYQRRQNQNNGKLYSYNLAFPEMIFLRSLLLNMNVWIWVVNMFK